MKYPNQLETIRSTCRALRAAGGKVTLRRVGMAMTASVSGPEWPQGALSTRSGDIVGLRRAGRDALAQVLSVVLTEGWVKQ